MDRSVDIRGRDIIQLEMSFLVLAATLVSAAAFIPQPIIKAGPLIQTNYAASSTQLFTQPPTILCLGETLWDSLPSGMYLGGAPSNVAMHLASLLPENNTVAIASCLGKDQLGHEAKRRLELKGVRSDCIQFHEEWETGIAIAIIDKNGDAIYQFNTPAAWDGLLVNEQLSKLINNEDDSIPSTLFIMGTIAARLESKEGASSASTLSTVRNTAGDGSVILDVNLRSPWYDTHNILELARGNSTNINKLALLKLNEEELVILEEWCNLKPDAYDLTGDILKQRMKRLGSTLNAYRICVTRGSEGAALWCEDSDVFHEHTGYKVKSDKDSDTVGAGDAFLAALVNALFVMNESPCRALERACALGGYVAGCRGATPDHSEAPLELRRIFQQVVIA